MVLLVQQGSNVIIIPNSTLGQYTNELTQTVVAQFNSGGPALTIHTALKKFKIFWERTSADGPIFGYLLC